MNYPLPTSDQIKKLFGNLFINKIDIKACEPWDPKTDTQYTVASYKLDNETPMAVAMVDLPAGASLAALLTRIPRGSVEDTLQEKKLSENLQDNLNEVLNICAKLLNSNESPHVKLAAVYQAPPLPEVITQIYSNKAAQVDYTLNIDGYFEGHLSFITTSY